MIHLKSDDIKNFKKIGEGTDGTVYKYNKNELIKLYHSNNRHCSNDEPIKIYKMGSYNHKIKDAHINYISTNNDEDIKLRSKDGIKKAIAKQNLIQNTKLPKDIVYVNNKFAGCLLDKSSGIQIHKTSFLTKKQKLEVVKKLLVNVQELLDNNVYHIDLSNSPYASIGRIDNSRFNFTQGHSHILVNPINLDINIIDLDGKSTVYTDRFNKYYYQKCMYGLWYLLIEYLTNNVFTDEELYEFMNYEIDSYYLEAFTNGNINFEITNELIKDLVKK